MLMPKSVKEDYAGATDEYNEEYICEKCGGVIVYNEEFIERWNNEIICENCIENIDTVEELLEILEYSSIFDLIDNLKSRKMMRI